MISDYVSSGGAFLNQKPNKHLIPSPPPPPPPLPSKSVRWGCAKILDAKLLFFFRNSYCNINCAFNLKNNLDYTYPLLEQSMQNIHLTIGWATTNSSKLFSAMEKTEKILEAKKKSMCCEVSTARVLAIRAQGFPWLTPGHFRSRKWHA